MPAKTRYEWIVAPAAFTGVFLVCALLYANVSRHQFSPRWDEVGHMVLGWQIWADLTDGRIFKLLRDSHDQWYWSFLHSWWVAAFLGAFGVTDRAARLSSFAAMLVTIPLAFDAGNRLFKERLPWAGLTAVALLLTLASLPGLASECMIELPAIMVSFFAILLYLGIERKPTIIGHACFGCALALVFWMKYSFGLALIAAFGIVAASDLLFNYREYRFGPTLAVLFPLLLVFVLWFVVPEVRVRTILNVLVNRAQGPQNFGWAYVLYYPNVILADAGWGAGLFLAGLLNSMWYLKRRGIRLLFSLCIFYAAILTIHHTKDARHVYPLYPPLILLAGFALAATTNAFFENARRSRAPVLSLVIVALLLRPLIALSQPRMPTHQELLPQVIAADIANDVQNASVVFVLGEFDALPSDLIAWELRKRGNRTPVYPSLYYKEQLEGVPSFTPGGSDTVNLSKLERLLIDLSADTVVTISVNQASPYQNEDYRAWNAWKAKYVDQFSSLPAYEKVTGHDYPSKGISVMVYVRRQYTRPTAL